MPIQAYNVPDFEPVNDDVVNLGALLVQLRKRAEQAEQNARALEWQYKGKIAAANRIFTEQGRLQEKINWLIKDSNRKDREIEKLERENNGLRELVARLKSWRGRKVKQWVVKLIARFAKRTAV